MSQQQFIKPTIATKDDATYGLNVLSTTPGGQIQIVTSGETVNTIGPDRHIVVGDVLVSPGHFVNIQSDYHVDGNITIEAVATGITIGTETYQYAGHVGVVGNLIHCTGTIDIQGGLTVGSTAFTTGTVATSGTSGTSGTGGAPLPVTTSLIAHFTADAGVTTAGEFVTSWADQGPNNYVLEAPTGREPDAIGVTLNGVNIPNTTVNYSNKYLVTPGNIAQIGATGTIFLVAAQYAGDNGYSRFVDNIFSSNYHISRDASNQAILSGVVANNDPYGAQLAATDGTFYTFRIVFDGTTTVITSNGTNTSTPYVNGITGGPQPLSMFMTADGASFAGKKAIAELIIYDDVLTTEQITAVEDYLVAKWAHY